MPSVVQFRSWKIAVRNEVAAASGRVDVGLAWMMEVEKESATFLSLADSGSFTTLDVKLSAALTGASTGVVGQEITTEAEKASQQCRLLRGRQALWLVYRWYATNQEQGAMVEMIDLMAVKSRLTLRCPNS